MRKVDTLSFSSSFSKLDAYRIVEFSVDHTLNLQILGNALLYLDIRQIYWERLYYWSMIRWVDL